MSQEGKVIKITFSEESNRETDLWMYRIMEKIILEQLEMHPTIKAELLRTNLSRINKIISGGD